VVTEEEATEYQINHFHFRWKIQKHKFIDSHVEK
jgi:hypothetical protein